MIVEFDEAKVPELVASVAQPHDVVLTMGAGSITAQGPRILERLAASAE